MTGKNRRAFIVRNGDTGDSLFVVEADDKREAIRRGQQILTLSGFAQNVVSLVIEECTSFEGLPFFMEAYFRLFRPPTLH